MINVCPVCGKLVEAKYLSDPPKKCDACRGSKVQVMKPASAVPKKLFTLPTLEGMLKAREKQQEAAKPVKLDNVPAINREADYPDALRYIGPTLRCGLIHNHKYTIESEKKDYVYWVTALMDATMGRAVDITIQYASKISIDQKFVKE